MSNIYAHPTMTSSPDLVQALQERLGLRAIVQGSRVQLVNTPPRWRYRTAPRGTEQRARSLFVVSPCAEQRREDLPGRPQ